MEEHAGHAQQGEEQESDQASGDQADGDIEDGDPSVTDGELQRWKTVRWESVLVTGDGGGLEVVFTGGRIGDLSADPCHHQYELDLAEAADQVTLTVHELRPVEAIEWSDDRICTGEGHQVRLTASLDSGLDGRSVIDGHDGSGRSAIDEAVFLVPGWLPEGWVERYREPIGSLLTIAYDEAGGSAFPLLTLTIAPVDDRGINLESIASRDLTESEEISVRGGDLNAVQVTSFEDGATTIAFAEDGIIYQVTLEDALVPTVGLRFVENLTPPQPDPDPGTEDGGNGGLDGQNGDEPADGDAETSEEPAADSNG